MSATDSGTVIPPASGRYMMPPELIRAALVFLQRVDIKGGEAMAMVQVCQALEAMARQEAMPRLPRPNGEVSPGLGVPQQ